MIGVCRGAQLMTAFAGGRLIQHVTGHHAPHGMVTSDGEVLSTTSCHHQMMYPWEVEHELLAWSVENRSNVYLDGGNKIIKEMADFREPEVVFYPQLDGVAIQGHPEWSVGSTFAEYCNSLITDLLLSVKAGV